MGKIAILPQCEFVRGDTAPFSINFKIDGADRPLTGMTNILLTFNVDPTPTNDPASPAEGGQLAGTLTATPTDGIINFAPIGVDEAASRVASEAFVAGLYFMDVQADDANGNRVTLGVSDVPSGPPFTVLQGVTQS